jgi:hypothetical protein
MYVYVCVHMRVRTCMCMCVCACVSVIHMCEEGLVEEGDCVAPTHVTCPSKWEWISTHPGVTSLQKKTKKARKTRRKQGGQRAGARRERNGGRRLRTE